MSRPRISKLDGPAVDPYEDQPGWEPIDQHAAPFDAVMLLSTGHAITLQVSDHHRATRMIVAEIVSGGLPGDGLRDGETSTFQPYGKLYVWTGGDE